VKREWKTFGADEQGSEFEHGLGEGLLLPAFQRLRHQLHHQPAEVRVSPHRLAEVDHSSDLRRTKTKTMHDMKASIQTHLVFVTTGPFLLTSPAYLFLRLREAMKLE